MNDNFQQGENIDQLENFEKPLIYSKSSIWGFSVFFSSLFGGILLMQNLRDIGKKQEANIVLMLSIILTMLPILAISVFNIENSVAGLIFNIAGAAVLSEYFYKKYFPDEADYEKKKVVKPLIVGAAIIIFYLLIFFLADTELVK